MIPHIRIEMDGLVGHKGEAYYVGSDGTKINISAAVQGADIKIRVGELNAITLYTIGDVRADAEVKRVLKKVADAA